MAEVLPRRRFHNRDSELGLGSIVGMKFLSALWPHLKHDTRPHFLRRALPLAAGISNVVCRDPWLAGRSGDQILDYRRAASTGPMLPVVVSPTSSRPTLTRT